MKRTVASILMLSLVVILLASCGANRPTIEEYEWHLRRAMLVEDEQLKLVAANEADKAHPEAKIVDVILKASNGKLTITDETSNRIYTGTYIAEGKTPEGTEYKIIINGVQGYAGVAMTTYYDGTEEPTLPISIAGYSLYFYA
ncbi:MAG: hypothetical protein IKC16_07290 [Clostridia bacterium]|nr:hypothetical protein [Clostridia bacterium]